jgi:[ribosomal protein S18]-alanine N-acetyltransferase
VVKRLPSAKLRRGRISDVDALLELEHNAFKAEPLSRQSLRHFLVSPSATFIVAKSHGNLAGYVLVRYSSRHRLARVYSIAVSRELRRQGLGRRLLAAVDKDATRRRCRAIRLEVRKYDRKAIRLYKSSGYRCFGEYPLYYEHRFDAFRFEKPLGGKNRVKLHRDLPSAHKPA